MRRLVLIDGFAVIHRAYHALPPLTAPDGQQINAVYGFTSMLLKIIEDLDPTYLVVAFDLPVPTFRHEAYIAYQAHRPYAEDNLKRQFQLVREIVEAADIPVVSSPGYEADDVIATLVKQALEQEVSEVVIVTGDRDILQLVKDGVKVYMPVKGLSEARLFDKKEVQSYLGIEPELVVDYKGLVGDASDNYPGVQGIGPKTAISLLQEFGSLEGVYEAISEKRQEISNKKQVISNKKQGMAISARVVEKLVQGYESANLSQKLAKIVDDAPVVLDLGSAEVEDLKNKKEFIAKIKEYRFKSLLARLGVENKVEPIKKKNGNGQMGLV